MARPETAEGLRARMMTEGELERSVETNVMFHTDAGVPVPAVTADQMRKVDRIAVEDFGLGILQMMENAGRSLALNVMDMLGSVGCPEGSGSGRAGRSDPTAEIVILVGSGGNGGGGLCCARHLRNRGFPVRVVLSKDPEALSGAAAHQLRTIRRAGVEPVASARVDGVLRRSRLVVDALVGYSLRGVPRGRVAELIGLCNEQAERVLSLDLPSGVDATTGETPGAWVQPERTLTLALPKTGLTHLPGELYLADIGIPSGVYAVIGLSFVWPVTGRYWLRLVT